jgi:hypothetical protein
VLASLAEQVARRINAITETLQSETQAERFTAFVASISCWQPKAAIRIDLQHPGPVTRLEKGTVWILDTAPLPYRKP